MRIALTGSSGRIGRAIHFTLCQEHDVIGIDRSVSSVTTDLGDINDFRFLIETFTGADAIVHTAALHAPHVGVYDDNAFFKTNFEGTRNVVRAALECGVRKLVFTSTTALFGHASNDPEQATWIDENTQPLPQTIYHRTKLEAEQYLEAKASSALKVTTLRMSRCFPEPAPLMTLYRLHRGIDARDVAEGHRLALADFPDNYRMLVLSGATPFQREDCVALKTRPERVLLERCPSVCALFAARHWQFPASIDRVCDSSRAQNVLGWKPMYGFEEVVRLLDAGIPEVLPAKTAASHVAE